MAEKLEALTALGLLNSRLRDYFDLWLLARFYTFDGVTLVEAIQATFQRRGTSIEALPIGLTPAFGSDPSKPVQWKAFLLRSRIAEEPTNLTELVVQIREFAAPPLSAAAEGATFRCSWQPGGPWVEVRSAQQ